MLYSDILLRSIKCKRMVDVVTKVAIMDWFITFVILDYNSEAVAQFKLQCIVLKERFLNLFLLSTSVTMIGLKNMGNSV